jgi:hypothetical protein
MVMEKVGEKVTMLVLLSTAMTDAQILELAEQYFDYQGGWIAYGKEDLLKFAWEIYGIASDETLQDYESKF